MLSVFVAAAILAQQPVADITSKEVVSKMLAKYYNAKTVVGTIQMRQSVLGHTLIVDTSLQLSKPDKLYIYQKNGGAGVKPRMGYVVCDGTYFEYSAPKSASVVETTGVKIVEERFQKGKDLQLYEILGIGSKSLIDRGTPIDLAVAGAVDIRYANDQWANLDPLKEIAVDGNTAYHVTGDLRAFRDAPVTGKYEMVISREWDLLKFVRHESIMDPRTKTPVAIDTIYDIRFEVNGKPDPKLFIVVLPKIDSTKK